MSSTILHYIHDPLCGWCYGAAPLVKAARDLLPVRAHGGGLMAGARRRPVTAELREYVTPHDRRIAQITGQPFGAAYFDGLLHDTSAVFDSLPPIAAILAAGKIADRELDMLARLQTAHYVEGRRIAERAVLVAMALTLGLDEAAFAQALDEVEGAEVQEHIAQTREFMDRLGVHGFPAFALEQEGRIAVLDTSTFLGRPEALCDWLKTRLTDEVELPTSDATVVGCGPDGCSV